MAEDRGPIRRRLFDIDRKAWYRQPRSAPWFPLQHIKYVDLGAQGTRREVRRVVPFAPVPVRLSKTQQQLLDDALTPHELSHRFQRRIEDALSRYRGLRMSQQEMYRPADIRAYFQNCILSARACLDKVNKPPRGFWYNATITRTLERYIAQCERDVTTLARPRSRPRDDAATVLGAGVIEALVAADLHSNRAIAIEVLRCVRQFAAQSHGERQLSRARTYAFARNALCRHLAPGSRIRASSR